MLVLKSTSNSSNTSLPVLRRDKVLSTPTPTADGVRFLFDTAYSYSFGGTPSNGAIVTNIQDTGSVLGGYLRVPSGNTLSMGGNGIDFDGLTKKDCAVVGPSNALASIWAAANQYFMVVSYVKLPTQANWMASSGILPFFATGLGVEDYTDTADILTIGLTNASGGTISARRQTVIGTIDTAATITPVAASYGQVAQVAFWRNATEQRMQLRTAAGGIQLSSSIAVGSNNSSNFSAMSPRWGMYVGGFQGALDADVSANAQIYPARNSRLYRGWVEDLSASGRNPQTVLDADWSRTVARGVFS